MIYDCTGIDGMPELLHSLGVRVCRTLFVERPFRKVGSQGVYGEEPDLGRLRRWLKGDVTIRGDASGIGPACHLVSMEFLTPEQAGQVLDVYAEVAPDIRVVLYDPGIRFDPKTPKAAERLTAAYEERQVAGVPRPTTIYAPEIYVIGQPAGSTGSRILTECNEHWTTEELPEFVRFNWYGCASLSYYRNKLAPCVHERYHHGHGLNPFMPMSLTMWQFYIREVLKYTDHLTWWSGPVFIDGRWVHPTLDDTYRDYAEVIASEVMRKTEAVGQ